MDSNTVATETQNIKDDVHLRNKMMKYWKVYSPTVESMMLSHDATYLAENEQNEVISYLPNYNGKKVLELGAGIGRFTAKLASLAGHITAVDFMQDYIDKNKEINGDIGNISFMCADVTKLDFPSGTFDVVFSNWLFMYLSDDETEKVFAKVLKWLVPGGYFFIRESCYHQSGNVKREENPTIYRTPLEYCNILDSIGSSESTSFKIIRGKSILTYIQYHSNPNQLCFLAKRIDGEESDKHSQFLQSRYSVGNIKAYERIFGHMWWSAGGEATNRDLCIQLGLQPGQRVLDVGCGMGGSASFMARHYGVYVHGVDLSTNMIHVAIERQGKLDTDLKKMLQFEISDVLTVDYEEESYDYIYSRDAIHHIKDKAKLLSKMYRWLKPGGILFFTDFCRGPTLPTQEFLHFTENLRHMLLVNENFYTEELKSAGFSDVTSHDMKDEYLRIQQRELASFTSARRSFINDFSEEEFDEITSSWQNKVRWTKGGQLTWVSFKAQK